MYPAGSKEPRIINVPPSYVPDYNPDSHYWSNVSVSNGKIYLVFHTGKNRRVIQKLAVLSLDGTEQQLIDLEPYYPLYSIYSAPVMADRHGGIYLELYLGLFVHYDHELRPELIERGVNNSFDDLVVGWDGNLYSYEFPTDILKNWGPSDKTVLIKHDEPLSSMKRIIATSKDQDTAYGRLIGADASGKLYFSFKGSNHRLRIIRLSEGTGVIGTIPEEWATDFLYHSLAPGGSLYSLVNNSSNFSTHPGIVECNIE
jgi:hypothetical protein